MTTLITFSTKDVIVMGCDSLGTVSRNMVDPYELAQYFDFDRDGELKTDENGKPVLSNFWKHIHSRNKNIPYSHMTHIDKLFRVTKKYRDIGGLDPKDSLPEIYRVNFPHGVIEQALDGGHYGIVFGGQFREIARLVYGTAIHNMRLIEVRYRVLLERFVDELEKANRDITVPDLDKFFDKFH